ncbi:MAG: hypothetical protein ISS15_08505 [Alphaproteobacteria bacterium]|nr:hypothetical protein [Alphaproteobacteria bacterium]MBL6936914.1 hypothetical protein [Alphaproteobacteria bacterium]MBL7097683.1 hypothetical protein [Alphaproteobacteria bacterium]
MSAGEPWLMRVEAGLNAHFKQANGASRPGTDWRIGLKRGHEVHTVLVRTYSDKVAPELAKDSQFMANTAMGYLNDLLGKGWDPKQPRELAITVTNPDGYQPKKMPFWKVWE